MSYDRDNNFLPGCICLIAFVVILAYIAVVLSVRLIIALFIGSFVLTFAVGIFVLLYEINAVQNIIPFGQNVFFPISSFEMFKEKNADRLHEIVCDIAKNTAMKMCGRKGRMRNEDIFVQCQKKAPRGTTLGCLFSIFKNAPLCGFRLARWFFGHPRDILNDNGENGPLDSDFVRGNKFCVGIAYAVLFCAACLRFIENLILLTFFCIFHFFFCWSKKIKHKDHSFYHSAFKCQRCGRVHYDVGPSIMGAGVFFQECACGETFCAAVPHASKKLTAVCPVCLEALNEK